MESWGYFKTTRRSHRFGFEKWTGGRGDWGTGRKKLDAITPRHPVPLSPCPSLK
jgi:hypothetical protein